MLARRQRLFHYTNTPSCQRVCVREIKSYTVPPPIQVPTDALASPADIRLIDSEAVRAVNSGMIILGGGLVKHHVCNANLMVRGSKATDIAGKVNLLQ